MTQHWLRDSQSCRSCCARRHCCSQSFVPYTSAAKQILPTAESWLAHVWRLEHQWQVLILLCVVMWCCVPRRLVLCFPFHYFVRSSAVIADIEARRRTKDRVRKNAQAFLRGKAGTIGFDTNARMSRHFRNCSSRTVIGNAFVSPSCHFVFLSLFAAAIWTCPIKFQGLLFFLWHVSCQPILFLFIDLN